MLIESELYPPYLKQEIIWTENMYNKRSVLITGSTGNVGNACMTKAVQLGWNIYKISHNLLDWEYTKKYIMDIPPLDLVIMTHGVQRTTDIEFMIPENWNYVIKNNLETCVSLMTALVSEQKLNRDALVIFFSSIQASQPRIGRAAYAAAKAGIEGFGRATAVEIGDKLSARAVTLRIGQMSKSMKGILFTEEQMKKVEEQTPLHLVTPEEIANFCFSLYNLKSITGEVIEISSGHAYNIW